MGRRSSSALYYMPLNFDEWAKLTPCYTLEEKGALLEACRVAWSAPTRSAPPCTLPDNEAKLEVLLGASFPRVKFAILQHFRPCREEPGTLRCAWLLTWWEESLKRYNARAKGGRAAARVRQKSTKEDSGQPSLSLDVARSAYAERTQPELNGVLTPHTGASLHARADKQPTEFEAVRERERHRRSPYREEPERIVNHNPPDRTPYERARPEVVAAIMGEVRSRLKPETE